MSMVRSNRLLPLLGLVVVAIVSLVGLKLCSHEETGPVMLDAVPQAPRPDADTPADTINTLTANVSAMTSELKALRRDNDSLAQTNRQLQGDQRIIENNVFSRLQRSLQDKQADQDSEASWAIAELRDELASLRRSLKQASKAQHSSTDIPVGVGLEKISGFPSGADALTWIQPLDGPSDLSSDDDGLLGRVNRATQTALSQGQPVVERLERQGRETLNASQPVYTIPRNATLIGSTAMTALIGRVPIGGQVNDPMPFKVIAGKDNLAANGLTLPGVAGMIWSGTAVGDWTLSCVTGRLESVTFVFEDGTLQTLSSDDQSLAGSSGNRDQSLGWVSDARGIPCITGERKTNAAAFLSQSIAVTALEAAGQAAAAAETTTLVHDSGATSEAVTGDRSQYILGNTLSGGSEVIARWLRERQSQNFDAVFVPAGLELAIHVDVELPIDYHTHGRRLHHANSLPSNANAAAHAGLD
ncbi:TIGR03752 family integrating conjugative element protein [Pseudomaricurvus alkylphenolicus]|uniref:TIGR03752 family integrating conjugative element protein n=1 Tax=Pseudomaricurvus alkylphenolicus TaxID=1306991 RepID=UPI00141E8CFE|nr:TIGR03752 family integrating conjugative element protein [Pseudomaricurvus alkylphenolicus]NIB44051.1 TIGR03752 family integrating conjugative element protein [Pseudomaricurvus alkylphenolicus]